MKSPVDMTFNIKMAIEKSAERISILKQASPRINSPSVILDKKSPEVKRDFSPPPHKKEANKVVPPWLIGGQSPEKKV